MYKELDPTSCLAPAQYELTRLPKKSTHHKIQDEATGSSSNTTLAPAEKNERPRVPLKNHPRSGPTMYEEVDLVGPFSSNSSETTSPTAKNTRNRDSPSLFTPTTASFNNAKTKNAKTNGGSVLKLGSEFTESDKTPQNVQLQIQSLQKKVEDMEKLIGQVLSRQSHMEEELKSLALLQKDIKTPSLTIYKDSSPAQVLVELV